MPIAVVCSGCSAKLNAPDAAAGKRVKCPKPGCGTVITVPAPAPATGFEVVDEEPPAPKKPAPAQAPAPKKPAVAADEDEDDADDVPKKPAKKPARAVADDEEDDRPTKAKKRARDDDEDDDDRPAAKKKRPAYDDEDDEDDDRPTKKKKKKGGMSPAVLAAIAVGALLVLGGVGYGVYALAFKKNDETAKGGGGDSAPKPDQLPGWTEYRSEQDKFSIRVPKPVSVNNRRKGQREYKSEDPPAQIVSVMVIDFSTDLPDGFDMRKMMEGTMTGQFKKDAKFKNVAERPVQFLGQEVTEIKCESPAGGGGGFPGGTIVIRIAQHQRRVYAVMVGGTTIEQAKSDAVFDTFQFIK